MCNRKKFWPIRLDNVAVPTKLASEIGADTSKVLKGLRYSDTQLRALRLEGVL